VAVGVTGFLFLLLGVEDASLAQEVGNGAAQAAEEATGTLRGLLYGFVDNLPKYGIAAGVLVVAGLLVRVVRIVLSLLLRSWERSNAFTALAGVVIWLLALGIATAVLVGDIRALVGSLGLVGLALSWALQTPIESFTGWLLNSFHGYYRVGDRVAVGDVFGDVYRIDFLTTTVWEYGSSGATSAPIHAEQPTGRLITFPNHEILTGAVVNYTRDFPYVWDELVVAVAPESDLEFAMSVVKGVGDRLLGDYMRHPAMSYEALIQREGLERSVPAEPQAFLSMTDWGANITLRYLVGAREKRGWSSRLAVAVNQELARPDVMERVKPVFPRQQIQMIDASGSPHTPPGSLPPSSR
jgi:small-conductance mechanosensitive channel